MSYVLGPYGAFWGPLALRHYETHFNVVLPHKIVLDQVNSIELTSVLAPEGYTGNN